MNNLLKYVNRRLYNRTQQTPPRIETEEEYYTRLFTESADWKTPNPNYEEELRWRIIKNYIFFIKGHFSALAPSRTFRPKILDIGCGRGWLTNLLAAFGDVQGIEPIGPVVKYANDLFPNLDISQGNIETVLVTSKKFDVVVCSEVIEHVVDTQKLDFLNKIHAVLNNNGFLIVTTPRKEVQELWMRYNQPGQPVEEWLDEATLHDLLIKCKFKKEFLSRFAIPPKPDAPEIEIYQLWLVQKTI